jgi:hypothetical protein
MSRGFLDAYHQVEVTYWDVVETTDDFGQPVMSGSATLTFGGVTGKSVMTRDNKGEEYHSELQVMLDEDLSLNCWIAEGDWTGHDLANVDIARRPVRKQTLRMIIGDEIMGYEYLL